MLVTCQRFGDLFLFGLIWQYSLVQTKSWLLTCSSFFYQNISNFFFLIYRRECAYNFPAMVIFVGPSSFIESLYSTFAGLAADPVAKVRKTLASSLHELAKLVGTSFNTTKVQIVRLFHGKNFL